MHEIIFNFSSIIFLFILPFSYEFTTFSFIITFIFIFQLAWFRYSIFKMLGKIYQKKL